MSGPYGETRYGNSNPGAAGSGAPFDAWADVSDFRAGTADNLALTPLSLASNWKPDGDSAGLFFTNATFGAQFNVDGPGFGFNAPLLAPLFTSSSDGKESQLSHGGLFLSGDTTDTGVPSIQAYDAATFVTTKLQFHGADAGLSVASDSASPFVFNNQWGDGFKFNQAVYGGDRATSGAGYILYGDAFGAFLDMSSDIGNAAVYSPYSWIIDIEPKRLKGDADGLTQTCDGTNYGSLRLAGDGDLAHAGMYFVNAGSDVAITTDGGRIHAHYARLGSYLGASFVSDFEDVWLEVSGVTVFSAGPSSGLRFWGGVGPDAQPAAIADATNATDVILRLNDLLGVVRSYGLIATA